MKLHILNDLHIEFENFEPPATGADVVVLAGDIGVGMDGDRVALWIHGHMHESFDYETYGTRVVCNPRGYAPKALNEGFDKKYTIEIS